MPKPASKLPSKSALKTELTQLLTNDLAALERAQKDAMEGATHEEAKPENDKDTRALEQSYLARGQARRVEELRTAVVEVKAMPTHAFTAKDPISSGALVTVEENDKQVFMLVAPQGGGTRLAGGLVQVVTPRSPLGEALVGKTVGDSCEVMAGGKMRFFDIIAVG